MSKYSAAFTRAAVFALPAIYLVGAAWAQTRPEQPYGQPSTARGDWPMFFADPTGSRYSPQDQINASNFSKLEVAWHFKTDQFGGNQPAISGNGQWIRSNTL